MENEIWLDVVGYEGKYSVSSMGQVKNLLSGKLLSSKSEWVGLCREGEVFQILRKKLVAEMFIPNPLNLPTVKIKKQIVELQEALYSIIQGETK
jgi:hypothetical protein